MDRKSLSQRPQSMPPLQKMQAAVPDKEVASLLAKKPLLRANTGVVMPGANKKPLLRANTVVSPGKKPLLRANSAVNGLAPQSKLNNISFAGNVMAELVECGVCLDRLNSPKMLPCQHTFCHLCLESLLKGTEVTCPTCRRVADVTGGVATLPSNLYLDSLLAAMIARGSGNVVNAVAPPNRCIQCQIVGNVTLCQHCQQMLCPVCWPDHVAELRRQMLCLTEQLQGASDKLSHKTEDFNDKCAKLHDYIDEAIKAKIASIQELKVTLNNEAREILSTGEESATQLKEKLAHAEKNISVLSFDNVTGDTQKVKMFLELHGLTAGLLAEVSNWGSLRPTFDRDSCKIHYQEDEDEDATQEEDETEEEIRARQLDMTSPDGISLQYRSRSATPRLSIMRSGLQRPAGITMSPWNPSLLFVAGTDNTQVLVVDRTKGRVVTRLTSPAMICPQGVACSANRIYVTDKWNHQIHVFSGDGEYLKALGKKGNGDGQMMSPEGIAAGINPNVDKSTEEDDDVLLYLCDAGNDRLQVMRAHDGSVVRTIGIVGKPVDGKMTTELSAPTGVAVNEHKVVVADCGNRRIKVYSLTGEKMLEFGSHGCGRGQFRSPECVAIDRFGFILVGDSGNGRIQIFRPNGNLVRTLGGRNAKSCNLGWISGITITDSMEIISADTKNHGIHFF